MTKVFKFTVAALIIVGFLFLNSPKYVQADSRPVETSVPTLASGDWSTGALVDEPGQGE